MQNKISIIVMTYDRKELLQRCLTSLIRQDYPKSDYEIIIVDDCSTDGTKEIVSEYCKEHDNIRYVRHEKNKGVATARNTGIRNAKKGYIAFIADDYIMPKGHVESINKFFDKYKNAQIMTSKIIKHKENNKYIARVNQAYYDADIRFKLYFGSKKGLLNKIRYLKTIPINNITKTEEFISGAPVFKKEIFEKYGFFDENLKGGEDTDYLMRLSMKDVKIYHNPLILVEHISRDTLKKVFFQHFNYGKNAVIVKKKWKNAGIRVPDNIWNFGVSIADLFLNPLFMILQMKSVIKGITAFPGIFFINLSYTTGVFYTYFKEHIRNQRNT